MAKGFKDSTRTAYATGGRVTNFGRAFRTARNSGAKTFTWNGKSYTTETREEEAAKRPPTTVAEVTVTAPRKAAPKVQTAAAPAAKPKPTFKSGLDAALSNKGPTQAQSEAKAKARAAAIGDTVKRVADFVTKGDGKPRQSVLASTREVLSDGPAQYKKGGAVKGKGFNNKPMFGCE